MERRKWHLGICEHVSAQEVQRWVQRTRGSGRSRTGGDGWPSGAQITTHFDLALWDRFPKQCTNCLPGFSVRIAEC